jgi:hypothetical protein
LVGAGSVLVAGSWLDCVALPAAGAGWLVNGLPGGRWAVWCVLGWVCGCWVGIGCCFYLMPFSRLLLLLNCSIIVPIVPQYVIDPGFCKQNSYNPRSGMESLQVWLRLPGAAVVVDTAAVDRRCCCRGAVCRVVVLLVVPPAAVVFVVQLQCPPSLTSSLALLTHTPPTLSRVPFPSHPQVTPISKASALQRAGGCWLGWWVLVGGC